MSYIRIKHPKCSDMMSQIFKYLASTIWRWCLKSNVLTRFISNICIWMLSHQLALPTSSAPSLHVCHLHHRQYDSLMITQSYFKDRWNMFDFITVLGSIVDALMVEFAVRAKKLFPNFKIICLQVLFIQRIAVDFFGLVCILEPYI